MPMAFEDTGPLAAPAADLRAAGAILLLSCYESGRPPLDVARPLAHLEAAGFRPAARDLAVRPLDPDEVRRARVVVLSVPMHTALRLGVKVAAAVRNWNPAAILGFVGLYAVLNADALLEDPNTFVLGGESDAALVLRMRAIACGLAASMPRRLIRLERAIPRVPSRGPFFGLSPYAHLEWRGERIPAAAVEASRGCKHLCRHCPLPPVYAGRFFAVPVETVLADVRQVAAAGARHVSFADPDFLNGPTHALRVARALHAEFGSLTFDFTSKVEHLLRYADLLPELVALGAVFVVSAFESMNGEVLRHLNKGHRPEEARTALELARRVGLTIRPTFVPFTPWETRESYLELLEWLDTHDLRDSIEPVQLSLRLLVPPGSLLLERAEFRRHLSSFDPDRFTWTWVHPDPGMDTLQRDVSAAVAKDAVERAAPAATFRTLAHLAAARGKTRRTVGLSEQTPAVSKKDSLDGPRRWPPPRLTEPWFC